MNSQTPYDQVNMLVKTPINKISKEDMKLLADHISDYLEVFTDVYIIPDRIKPSQKKLNSAIRVTEKLIKKLWKGDRSVFKNWEDWESNET